MSSRVTDQFIAAARLRVVDRDPDRAVVEAFIAHLEEIIESPTTGANINDHADITLLLDTLRDGIEVIADCWANDEDIEDPLTGTVGPYYAEPLNWFMDDARSVAAAPDNLPALLNNVIASLAEYNATAH